MNGGYWTPFTSWKVRDSGISVYPTVNQPIVGSWTALDAIPVSKSCRVMKLLDLRAFELKSTVHDAFDHVWDSLIRIDAETQKIVISETLEGIWHSAGNLMRLLTSFR